MVMANQPTPPPGASTEWGWPRAVCEGFLADRSRKKLITKLNEFILVFYITRFGGTPKMMHATPPDAPLCSRYVSLLPSIDSASFWLVVVFVLVDWCSFKANVLLIFV